MFDIKIDDARYWKNCVDSIVNLVDEGSFSISKEGVSLKAMDPSGISMVVFNAPNKIFSKYNVSDSKDSKEDNKEDKAEKLSEKAPSSSIVGLNLDNFSKLLDTARSGEQLIIKDKDNRVIMNFVGNGSHRDYILPMIDVRKASENEPKIEFDSFVKIRGDHIKSIIRDASQMSTYLGLKVEENSLIVSAKGDAGEMKEEFEVNKDQISEINVKSPSSSTFNLDYLSKMIKACPSNEFITLSMKTDQPIKLNYKIGDAEVSYYLAPYME